MDLNLWQKFEANIFYITVCVSWLVYLTNTGRYLEISQKPLKDLAVEFELLFFPQIAVMKSCYGSIVIVLESKRVWHTYIITLQHLQYLADGVAKSRLFLQQVYHRFQYIWSNLLHHYLISRKLRVSFSPDLKGRNYKVVTCLNFSYHKPYRHLQCNSQMLHQAHLQSFLYIEHNFAEEHTWI